MSTMRKKKMMGEWSRYNFFPTYLELLWWICILLIKQNKENRRLRNKFRHAYLDDAHTPPHENIDHGWFRTRDGI